MKKLLFNTFLIIGSLILEQQTCSGQTRSFPKHSVDPKLINIIWDTTSLRHVAEGAYARMAKLRNGKLITVYAASNGNTEVVSSDDDGDHWSGPVIVAPKDGDMRMDAPDIFLLHDNSLLVCYNPRPPFRNTDTSQHFAIRVVKSYDDGITWKDDELLYEASYLFNDGCWEPSAIQLPSGEIQLFFSNEGIYTKSNEQDISVLRSFDNAKTWTLKPQVVSFRKGSRDGMPVPVYLAKTKEILFSIEDNGFTNFKPYIIRSPAKQSWNDVVTANSPLRRYALRDSLDKRIYAGAPYLSVLSNGNILLSYQSTQFRSGKQDVHNAEMVVTVGDASGLNFTNTTIPFKIPEDRTGLWNSLIVLNDHTIIALTSTNEYKNKTEVWMIKGELSYRNTFIGKLSK